MNKTTASVKQALVAAFDRVKVGTAKAGVDSLVAWGDSQPAEFYKLWAKMLPTEVTTDPDAPLELKVRFVRDSRA